MSSRVTFLAWLCLLPALAPATTVTVPLHFGYGFVRQALLASAYDAEGRLIAFQDPSGCSRVILADPRLGGENGQLHLRQQAEIRLGTAFNGRCTYLIDWRGRLETWHHLEIADSGSGVRFPVVASRLYDPSGAEIPTGPLIEQVRRFAAPRLNDFSVALTPALDEVKTLLPQVLPQSSPQLAAILDSLAVTGLHADADALRLSLRFEVPELPAAAPPEPPLTAEELARWERTWEQWDAFLTAAIKQAARDAASPALRHTLEAILLDARYVWREALAADTPTERVDPVRAFFLDTWDRLAPVFGELAAQLPAAEGIHYAAFVSAVDTLKALDALGPALGLEISSAGLRRLARILIRSGGDPLQYREEVDPELRRLFGLPPGDDAMEPINLLDWLLPPAHADQLDRTLVARLNGWAPDRNDAPRYLPLAHRLLVQVAEDRVRSRRLPGDLHPLYRNLVLAAAWQESCWRQFIRQGGRVIPLVSASGDVGILQVNVRVWRGFYHPQRLRDDIAYNARAGSEILLRYLADYALARGEHRRGGSRDALARSAYAMYNGGPSHISRYRKRGIPVRLQRIDQAFWNKYRTIQRQGPDAVAGCYGDRIQPAKASRPSPKPAAARATADPGTAWIRRQNPNHYTLQLAALQNEAAARAFLKRIGVREGTYFRFRRQGKTWYAVIVGVHRSRAGAETAAAGWRRRLALPTIWIRDFGSLQNQIR